MPDPSETRASAAEPGIEHRTVIYQTAASSKLKMELYLPPPGAGDRPGPGVVLIHGGGWSKGRPEQFASHARDLARHGILAATPAYRLAPEDPYPAALRDCQAAVRWLIHHAQDLALDPGRIAGVGSSAGGHLAACLGVAGIPTEPADEADPALCPEADDNHRLRGVVDFHGVHDFTALTGGAGGIGGKIVEIASDFLGGPADSNPDAWHAASPIGEVTPAACPFLLFHDPDDPLVPFDQSTRFADRLKRVDRLGGLIQTPGSGHGFVYNLDNPWADRVWPVARRWLKHRLDLEDGVGPPEQA